MKSKVYLAYIPHGIDQFEYKPIRIDNPGKQVEVEKNGNKVLFTEYEEMIEFRKSIFQGKDFDFVVFFNNRNIRRKMPGDVILAFKTFCDNLTPTQKKKVALLMHTHVVDNNGTDLAAVARAVAPDCNIVFSDKKLDPKYLNYMYNISSVTINMASNEGFGLSTAESLMAGTPIIANVTGGLQDQMGFVDENGEYLNPDKHYNFKWGSNHDGKYKKHGEWVIPLWPSNRALVGSPPTPYIFDDRCKWEDAAEAIMKFYRMDEEERDKRGLKGREYLLNKKIGMTANEMGRRFVHHIDSVLEKWEPKERAKIYKL